MINYFLELTYNLDELAIIMIALVSYIGVCVTSFASRYMKGDTKYKLFFIRLTLLIVSVIVMVSTDHLVFLLIASCLSNFVLVSLMIHKSSWKAAQASGIIAAKNYLLSAICLGMAFAIFYFTTGETNISRIILENKQPNLIIDLALMLILVASMIQSAIWPFHNWLLSSLNSPTPVSAIMHAGLINGGGFLLVRFAPLYLQSPILITFIFFLGMFSASLGTLLKLMQSDVKRMLACSTMGQMGFMFVQCGIGLFPLAVAHLFWHGMFKAYLFLASGSAAQEKRFNFSYPPKILTFMCALICGIMASFAFAYTSHKSWLAGDSTLVLMMLALISGSQLALPLLYKLNFRNFLLAVIITIIAALTYGYSVHLIVWFMKPMKLMHPQPLNIFHIAAIIVLTLTWLAILFMQQLFKLRDNYSWMLKSYVKALNFSQPHPDTITYHRNHYKYQ